MTVEEVASEEMVVLSWKSSRKRMSHKHYYVNQDQAHNRIHRLPSLPSIRALPTQHTHLRSATMCRLRFMHSATHWAQALPPPLLPPLASSVVPVSITVPPSIVMLSLTRSVPVPVTFIAASMKWQFDACQFDDGACGMSGRDDKWW